MRKGIILVASTVIVTTILFWFTEDALAMRGHHRKGVSGSSNVPRSYNHVLRVSPRPPGWPQMWLAREIIKTLNKSGLSIDHAGNVSEDEIDILHADIKAGLKFSIRSDEHIRSGCVLEFEKKKDFETIQDHYLDMNNNNELHTWSLVKDNILVVIEGAMPEKEIQAYKAVLMNIK